MQKKFSVDVWRDNVKKYNLELRSDSFPLNSFKNEEIYSENLKMNLRNKQCDQPKHLEGLIINYKRKFDFAKINVDPANMFF